MHFAREKEADRHISDAFDLREFYYVNHQGGKLHVLNIFVNRGEGEKKSYIHQLVAVVAAAAAAGWPFFIIMQRRAVEKRERKKVL